MKAMGFVSCVVACLAALALPASGDDKYWMPATGDWADPANWDPAGVPTSADDAYIDNGGTATIASSVEAHDSFMGDSAAGTAAQTGGTHSVGHQLVLGLQSGATGGYELQSGKLTVGYNEHLGFVGIGFFTQIGGTHSVAANSYLGVQPGGTGTYQLQDGQLTVGESEYLGFAGTSTFTQSGGIHNVSGDMYLGYNLGAAGVYEMHDGLLDVGGTVSTGGGAGVWVVDCPATVDLGALDLASGSGRLKLEVLGDVSALLSVSQTASLGGELFVNTSGSPRLREGATSTIITAGGGFINDFAKIESDVANGIPEGLGAFSGNIRGTIYEVMFTGLTAGDANGDHRASLGDLCIMAGNWNQSGKSWADADFNGDGTVSIGDLCMLAGNWGWELPGGAAVPGPATLSLLTLGGLAVVRRRH